MAMCRVMRPPGWRADGRPGPQRPRIPTRREEQRRAAQERRQRRRRLGHIGRVQALAHHHGRHLGLGGAQGDQGGQDVADRAQVRARHQQARRAQGGDHVQIGFAVGQGRHHPAGPLDQQQAVAELGGAGHRVDEHVVQHQRLALHPRGDVGRQRRAIAARGDAEDVAGRAQGGGQARRVAGGGVPGIEAATTGLKASTTRAPGLERADQGAADVGLADVGACAGDEQGGHQPAALT